MLYEVITVYSLTRHHPGTHGGSHTKFNGAISIGFAYFGVVGQANIVVKAPVQNLRITSYNVCYTKLLRATYDPFQNIGMHGTFCFKRSACRYG